MKYAGWFSYDVKMVLRKKTGKDSEGKQIIVNKHNDLFIKGEIFLF